MIAPTVFSTEAGPQPRALCASTTACTVAPALREKGGAVSTDTGTRQLRLWKTAVELPSQFAVSV